jgi:hypothetical protein
MEAPRRFGGLLTAALLGLAPAPRPVLAGEAGLHAVRVTEANAIALLPGGPDAIGGIGDWALGNGTLCAVVSDSSHESILSGRGGFLVDLGHCDRDDDQFNILHALLNASQEQVPAIREISAQISDGEARIVTEGAFEGGVLTTTYALDLVDPEALRIRSELHRVASGPRVRMLGDVSLHGNGSLAPFTVSTRHPESTVGFAHPQADPDEPLEMIRAISPADLHVWVGADALEPGIAYGLRLTAAKRIRAGGESRELLHFSINGVDFSMLGILSRPCWLGGAEGVGPLALIQAPFMDVAVGDTLLYEREIRVGARADVASVTDQLWPDAPRVAGRIDDPSARLHVDRDDGTPVTQVRPSRDGTFAFRIPRGNYRLRAVAPGARALERAFRVGQAEVELDPMALGAASRVRLPQGHAVRLVFEGSGGTPSPRLGDELLGFRVGDTEVPTALLANDVSLAGVPGDREAIVLAPGRYQVYATRGPEYGVRRTSISVGPGEIVPLEIEMPERVLMTPGWISADLHVHAVGSDDSTLPLRTRIDTLLAQGLEVVVSTDHDQSVDYGPLIARLGLTDRVASVVGVEITSTAREAAVPYTAGHLNAFPLPLRPQQYRDGAPQGEGLRVREIVRRIHGLGGERLVQMNHPRAPGVDDDILNYFSHLSVAGEPFDPTVALEVAPNRVMIEPDRDTGLRDLDFDAVELMNGPSMIRYYRTRADWFSLLLQGEFRAATANSDSHLLGQLLGQPRNYVRLANDTPRSFDEATFIRAVREGRLYGTTGPLLEVGLGHAGLGESFRGRSGTLRVEVKAADWVPVSTLRVYVNAARERELPIRAGEIREVSLEFARDSFVTIEVEGEVDATFEALNPGFPSFAFTNPIFVDADGDGEWTAPGLPASLPATIRDPLRDLE